MSEVIVTLASLCTGGLTNTMLWQSRDMYCTIIDAYELSCPKRISMCIYTYICGYVLVCLCMFVYIRAGVIIFKCISFEQDTYGYYKSLFLHMIPQGIASHKGL